MSKEAMQQAMEALKESIDVPCYGGHPKQEAAYQALQEALANEALDKKAENARELGLDYKPAKYSDIVSDGGLDPRNKFDKPAQQEFVSPGGGYVPAIPAQQEPATQRAHEMALRQWERWKQYALELQEKLVKYEGGAPMVLNTYSPQRTWVGLMDEEISKEVETELTHYWNGEYIDTTGARDQLTAFARAIEAKLKEKNNEH